MEDPRVPRGTARFGRRGLVFFTTALVTVAAVPIAWASHVFSDVPTSSPHHDDIAAIQYAGITGGCGPGIYCPGQAVRRDQMASFVRRGAVRTGYGKTAANLAPTLSTSSTTLAVVAIQVGGAAGGTQTVKLDGVVTARIGSIAGCPCVTEYFVSQDGVGPITDVHLLTNTATSLNGGPGGVTGPVTVVRSVPAGTTQTFRLVARRDASGVTGSVVAHGALSAISGIFGASGGP